MAELGPGAPAFHREVGEHARAAGIDLLIGVGEPARDYGPDELVGDPEEAAELLAAQLEPRRRRPRQGLALGRPRGGRRDAVALIEAPPDADASASALAPEQRRRV